MLRNAYKFYYGICSFEASKAYSTVSTITNNKIKSEITPKSETEFKIEVN